MCCACHSLCRPFMEPLCLNHTTYFTHAGNATSVSVRPPWRADAAGQSGAQDVLGSEPDAHRWLGATAPSACRTTLQRALHTRESYRPHSHCFASGRTHRHTENPVNFYQGCDPKKEPGSCWELEKACVGQQCGRELRHGSCPGPICFAWFWFLQSYDSGFRVSP